MSWICGVGIFVAAILMPGAAGGQAVVHPIYSHVQDAPQNELAMQRFTAAARKFGLGPVEIVDIDGDAPPRAAEKLRSGLELVRKLDFGPGLAALDDAAAEVAATGGGGLNASALSDLFVYRAWAIGRFDFNRDHVPAPTARAQAYADLIRAVILTPKRQFNTQQFPPLLLEDWSRAVADAAARSQGTLVVLAAPEALITCDGGTPVPGPATFVGLTQGEHLIRVEEPGWTAWGATVSVNAPALELQVPPRRALSLDGVSAAARARRMGLAFALVAEPRPGRDGGLWLALRLVDTAGAQRDAAIAPLAGDPGALDAAVMRLDEQARRMHGAGATQLAPAPYAAPDPNAGTAGLPPPVFAPAPPTRARLADNPGAWARDNWPVLTAVGVMVGAAIILSITLGN